MATFSELCKNSTDNRSTIDLAILELFKTQPVVMSIAEEGDDGKQKKPYIAVRCELVQTKAVRIASPNMKGSIKAQVDHLMTLVKGNDHVVVEDRLDELYHASK